MIKSTFDLEKELLKKGYHIVIGIDEAGRGPLAGPVVASAVAFKTYDFVIPEDKTKQFDLVRDSKKLSHKQREDIFDFIHEHFWVGVGICDHHTIDRINILEATYLAAKMAVADLLRKIDQDTRNKEQANSKLQNPNHKQIANIKIMILFDGNKLIPNFSHEQRAIVGGDGITKSISAASIIAKVTRDRIMLGLDAKYPAYDFKAHKGYGTKLHMEMIHLHGPSEIHRQSFEPMKSMRKKK